MCFDIHINWAQSFNAINEENFFLVKILRTILGGIYRNMIAYIIGKRLPISAN